MKTTSIAKKQYTSRGFAIYEFNDRYNVPCSLQKSSLATEDAIWLGVKEGEHIEGECLSRMHVDKKLARWLIKKLQKFVDTGEI